MSKSTHVMYDKDSGDWYSKDSGNERASRRFDTQQQAADWATGHAKNVGSELNVHRKDNNQIRYKNSHGNDPRNIKG